MIWRCADFEFDTKMPIVMGILNVTPDSFSDGGTHADHDEAVAHARKVKKFFEEEGLAKGLASVSMDGGMVDTPVYVSACETIERYEAIQAKEAKRK